MQDFSKLRVGTSLEMPPVGLGIWKIPLEQTAEVVFQAIRAGYRHIDSACDYGNESEAGKGIKRALDEGICQRAELWITSKLWNTYHRKEHVAPALERSLHDLGLEYLDLYLVHFPIALQFVSMDDRYPPGWIFDPDAAEPKLQADQVPIAETWSAMESIYEAGKTRAIGVCNFGCSLLRDLNSHARVPPAVLQVESHPYLVQPKLLRYCQDESIAFTAFSPLGSSSYVELGMAEPSDSVLREDVVGTIAVQVGKTPAQVVLRWGVQRGTAVIPKTSRVERLAENLDVFDFELDADQMRQISALDKHRRFNDPGDFCEAAFGRFFPIYE